MKRASLLIIVSLFVITLFCVTSVDAAIGLQWSFEEGDFIDYRITSDGMVEDEIVSFRIDTPLPDMVELPPDTYNLGALDHWMEIPTVPVTAFIPFGSSTTESSGFENIFTYGGLAAGYWCRFAVPTGVSDATYEDLVAAWTDGPHGTIETHIIDPPTIHSNLYWGFEYGFEFSDTIYNVTAWYYIPSPAAGRLANVTITGHDSTSGDQTHYMMMVSDWKPPFVMPPNDFSFTVGTTGEEIDWHILEVAPFDYEVFRNGTSVASGTADEHNMNVKFSLDGLEVGVWNFTVVITDYLLNTASASVIVTVESSLAIGTDMLLIIGGIGAIVVVGAVIMIRRR